MMNGAGVLRLMTGIMKKMVCLDFMLVIPRVVYGGGVTGVFTAPKDLLKTKLMVDRHYYNGLFHCIAKIFVT